MPAIQLSHSHTSGNLGFTRAQTQEELGWALCGWEFISEAGVPAATPLVHMGCVLEPMLSRETFAK